ncbi:GSCFA domain-containing protein [Flavobacterium sp. DG1-102-2]|uniref:GSCFA domain-containing protein n=1 Tax=Flavobacterium sp. DG1-102-2 TaxID=3081663 RepID=UPI002949DC7E|nr:GSCFA domain-containing protein [Flavobacterium sp. DG1-102-2]MDV6168806.1 GSCFA domain-containing protein [Flavobacterium sp. DG1-102-2]
MQFSTQIPIAKSNNPIDYTSKIVSLGSCFAVNIGQKLDYFKFSNTTNPFGILFHPLALEKFIGFAVNNKQFTEADIFEHNGLWHCFDAHSDLSSPDKNVLLNNLNNACALASAKLKQATHIIITLGTAWVYRYTQTGNLVANCHKVPQKEFTKELLSVDTIRQSLENIIASITKANPDAHIIFTVSPVRHLKDGFTENLWSKSNLVSALLEVIKNKPQSTNYFPSYEIIMDELRDYRFYAEDMIHPSATAINYIWERFTEAYITNEAQDTMKLVDTIQKSLQHRPFNPDTPQHKSFVEKLNSRIDALQKDFPQISF